MITKYFFLYAVFHTSHVTTKKKVQKQIRRNTFGLLFEDEGDTKVRR